MHNCTILVGKRPIDRLSDSYYTWTVNARVESYLHITWLSAHLTWKLNRGTICWRSHNRIQKRKLTRKSAYEDAGIPTPEAPVEVNFKFDISGLRNSIFSCDTWQKLQEWQGNTSFKTAQQLIDLLQGLFTHGIKFGTAENMYGAHAL